MVKTFSQTELSQTEYCNKVYGGWLGKNIGGTLGAPVEGVMEQLNLTYYINLPEGPTPNDDLDLQLVWLHALEQYGPGLSATQLGQAWLDHVVFPFDEYGYALGNLRRGLIPPVTGSFNNPFADCMGSPIRSEIWAMITPGVPALAAYYAYQDAIVDHAGGEGVWGEIFFATIESAAFVSSDRDWLIGLGLSYLPAESRVARAVSSTLEWFRAGYSWLETRELILQNYGHPNPTDAPQNIAFVILGWLYGENFGDALLKTVNCGYDTDSSGAALGAILGIVGGKDNLPDYWIAPLGEQVNISREVKGFRIPTTLAELTERTLIVARQTLATWNTGIIIRENGETNALENFAQFTNSTLQTSVITNPATNIYLLPLGSFRQASLELEVDYGSEGPAIGQNQAKTLVFNLKNCSSQDWQGTLELVLPQNWRGNTRQFFELEPEEQFKWEVTIYAGEQLAPTYNLELQIHRTQDEALWHTQRVNLSLVAATHWVVTGPDEVGKKVIFPGSALNLASVSGVQQAGTYRASTTVINPRNQQVQLIVATEAPLKVSLDGTVVLEDSAPALFMPSFNRPDKKRYTELDLSVGKHSLEIEVTKGVEPVEFWVVFTVARNKRLATSEAMQPDILMTW